MLDYELKYCKNYKYIAGFDEAGRGCCAGPLVVAAVIMPKNYMNDLINDSKQLNRKKREGLYKEIIANCIDYKTSILSAKEVDKLNPKQASKTGMFRL